MNKDTKAQHAIEETGKKPVDGQDHPPADRMTKSTFRTKVKRLELAHYRIRATRAYRQAAAKLARAASPRGEEGRRHR